MVVLKRKFGKQIWMVRVDVTNDDIKDAISESIGGGCILMADTKMEHKCPACEHGAEKKEKKMEWLTGPDQLHGGDGLPDWMQFTITGGMFGILYWVLHLLFHPTLELDENT